MRTTNKKRDKKTLLAALMYMLGNQNKETTHLTKARYTAAVKRLCDDLKKETSK